MTRRRATRQFELLESRHMLAGDFQSPYQPLDANVDLVLDLHDASDLVSVLSRVTDGQLPQDLRPGLFPDVSGDDLVTAFDLLRVINRLNVPQPFVTARLLHDSSLGDESNFDLVTNRFGLEVQAFDVHDIAVSVNDVSLGAMVPLMNSQRIVLTHEDIVLAVGENLVDGSNRVTIVSATLGTVAEFQVDLDRQSPTSNFDLDAFAFQQQGRSLVVTFSEALAAEVASVSPNDIEIRQVGVPGDVVLVDRLIVDSPTQLSLTLSESLDSGNYEVMFPSVICDVAGNAVNSEGVPLDVVRLYSFTVNEETQLVSVTSSNPTPSVLWDAAVQQAVIQTSPGPAVASRAYAMTHTAMYDAWSAYDQRAVSTTLGDTLQRPSSENILQNKLSAMSFAAHRVLVDLFPSQSAIFDALMTSLSLEPGNDSLAADDPAGIGNRVANALLAQRHVDGSNSLGTDTRGMLGIPYSDTTGYLSTNRVDAIFQLDEWTPEYVPIGVGPGESGHIRIQQYLTPHWGTVEPFALSQPDALRPEPPQPFLLVEGTVDLASKTILLSDSSRIPITRSIVGTIINPKFVEQADQVIEASAALTDEEKLIAEFWEDGARTSFPPGTWMTFGQFVSARDGHSLDDDAKMFFALSNALFDAGIATWEAKTYYNYVRPVRAIRTLGELGLIGNYDSSRDGWVIDVWTPSSGTQSILATEFLTYQTPGGDPSPPFAEYTSGHSSFSAAGATILELFSGSSRFDASLTFEAGSSRFEPGLTPANDVILAWATFRDAADQAGSSRIYGGIHFSEGDTRSRELGNEVAAIVWQRAQQLILGSEQS